MTFHNVPTHRLAEIIEGLVKAGLMFEVRPTCEIEASLWTITLTGGY